MNKKKVLHFIESGGLYGAEQVILNLSKKMIECSNYFPIVGCIVQKDTDEPELLKIALKLNIPAIKVRINNLFFIFDIIRTANCFKKHKIDLIHSHGYKPSVFGFIIKQISGIEITSTCHLWFFKKNAPFKYRVMVGTELFFYKFFKKIIAVSDQIKKSLLSKKINKNSVIVIENGISIEDFNNNNCKNSLQIRADYGCKKSTLLVLNTGRLTEQKAQNTIIEAAKILKNDGYLLKYLIAGDGELKKDLNNLIRRYDLEKDVYLLGFRSDVKDLLFASDIFLLPSLDEGLPISILEAMASKKIIIASDVGKISELITDGVTGFIIKKGNVKDIVNKLKFAVNLKDEKKEEIILKTHERVTKLYSDKQMAAKYEALYDMLIH